MESKNQLKEYTNGEITVVWDASKCIHAGLCAGNLPIVFRPEEKPWVDIHGAESAQIADQVSQCPSGALSFRYNK
ncbi:MAG: (4Fe-4S)-binding protein [Cyclobacteriaceae bacterium]